MCVPRIGSIIIFVPLKNRKLVARWIEVVSVDLFRSGTSAKWRHLGCWKGTPTTYARCWRWATAIRWCVEVHVTCCFVLVKMAKGRSHSRINCDAERANNCFCECHLVPVSGCRIACALDQPRVTIRSRRQVSADDRGHLRQWEGSITREPDDDDDDQGWCRVWYAFQCKVVVLRTR